MRAINAHTQISNPAQKPFLHQLPVMYGGKVRNRTETGISPSVLQTPTFANRRAFPKIRSGDSDLSGV